jgi:hypothetical protein
MGSFGFRVFHPLDLETIDRVYEAAWAQIIARDPFRNTEKDGERQAALRKRLFALAGPGSVDFDTLCDNVLASMSNTRTTFSELGNSRPMDGDEGQAP